MAGLVAQYFVACIIVQFNNGYTLEEYSNRLVNAYTIAQAEELLDDIGILLNQPTEEIHFEAKAQAHCKRASVVWNHGRHFQDIGRRSRWGILNDVEKRYMHKVLNLMKDEIEKAKGFCSEIVVDYNNLDEYKEVNGSDISEDLKYKIALLSGWHALDFHALGGEFDQRWVSRLSELYKRASPEVADILLSDLSWLDVYLEDLLIDPSSLQYSRPEIILSSLRSPDLDQELKDEFWFIYLTNFIQGKRWRDAFLLAEFYCRENLLNSDPLKIFSLLWKICLNKNIPLSFKVKEKMIQFSRGQIFPVLDPAWSLAGLEFLIRSENISIKIAFQSLNEIKKFYDKDEHALDTWARFLEVDLFERSGQYLKAFEGAVAGAEFFAGPYRDAFVAKVIELISLVESKKEYQGDLLLVLNKLSGITIKGIEGDQLNLAVASRMARAGELLKAIEIFDRVLIDSPLFLESAFQQMQIYDRELDNFLQSYESVAQKDILFFTSKLKKKIKEWRLIIGKKDSSPLSITSEKFLALLTVLDIQSERVFDQPKSAIKILESALESRVVLPTERIKKIYAELLDRTGRRNEAQKIFQIIGQPELFQEIARRELEEYIYSSLSSSAWDNRLMKNRAIEYGSLLKGPNSENYFDWILVGKSLDRAQAFEDSLVTWKQLKDHYPNDGETLTGFVNSVFEYFNSDFISIKLSDREQLIGDAILSVQRLLETAKQDLESRDKYWWCQSRLVHFGYLTGRHEGLIARIYHLKTIDPNLGGEETFKQIDAIREILEDDS